MKKKFNKEQVYNIIEKNSSYKIVNLVGSYFS